MSNSSARDARKAETQERRLKALELRKAGASYDRIAEALGFGDRAGAHKAVKVAIAEITAEPAREVLTLELERLDSMLVGLWTKAKRGDVAAVDRALRIMDRRAKYLGLDAETSIAVSASTADKMRDEIVAAAKAMRDKLKSEDPSRSD